MSSDIEKGAFVRICILTGQKETVRVFFSFVYLSVRPFVHLCAHAYSPVHFVGVLVRFSMLYLRGCVPAVSLLPRISVPIPHPQSKPTHPIVPRRSPRPAPPPTPDCARFSDQRLGVHRLTHSGLHGTPGVAPTTHNQILHNSTQFVREWMAKEPHAFESLEPPFLHSMAPGITP